MSRDGVSTAARPVETEAVAALAAQLRPQILERWPSYYPGRVNGQAPTITFTPRHFGYSLIFQVDLQFGNGAGCERFMIKIRRDQKHGTFLPGEVPEHILALNRSEYLEHVKAYTFFAGQPGGLSVVRPLDFLESHNAPVVEHAVGHDLSKLMKGRSPLASPALRRCGEWWRLFHHQLHSARYRAWDPAAADEILDLRLERIRKFGAPQHLLSTVREEIRAAARRVQPVPIPVSLVHGDCKLRHVWATADGIQVLDFGNTKIGDSWKDPAALVAELSLYSLWSQRLDSEDKVADMRTLLRAYFDGPPPPLFSLYVVDCLLKKWHRRLRNWGPGSGITGLRRSLKTARLDKPVERLYMDRWFTTQIRAWLGLAEDRPPSWLQPVGE